MNIIQSSNKQNPPISANLRSNLSFLSSLLSASENSLISISSSSNSQNHNQNIPSYTHYFPLVQSFLTECSHPFKAVGLYARLLQIKEIDVKADAIFAQTFLSPKIHKILSAYLFEKTAYFSLSTNYEKILDVFYKFLFCEYGELMEIHLKNKEMVNIGKWFYEEGMVRMFRRYSQTSHQFTLFLCQFMLNGIAALFLAAVTIMKKQKFQPSEEEMNLVKVAYIKKYGLE